MSGFYVVLIFAEKMLICVLPAEYCYFLLNLCIDYCSYVEESCTSLCDMVKS